MPIVLSHHGLTRNWQHHLMYSKFYQILQCHHYFFNQKPWCGSERHWVFRNVTNIQISKGHVLGQVGWIKVQRVTYVTPSPSSGEWILWTLMSFSCTDHHDIVTPGVKYIFTTPCPPMKRARLQPQSSMSTLNSESTQSTGSPPALEYADSPERNSW